jgi:hypothetical protein
MNFDFCFLRFASCVLAAGLFTACGTERKPVASGLERKMSDRLRNWDVNQKSPFEKQFSAIANTGKDADSMFTSKAFHTSNYGGNKTYAGMKNFHSKEFAQSKKGSRYETQSSNYAKQDSRYATQISAYASKDSPMGTQAASQDKKSYRDANEAFGTGDFRAGKKSMDENNRPKIFVGELEPGAKTTFTEAEIKRMVNR